MPEIRQIAERNVISLSDDNPVRRRYLKYRAWREIVDEALHDMKRGRKLNDAFIRGLRNPQHSAFPSHDPQARSAIGVGTVHVDAIMQGFSTRYVNEDYVGEALMPVANVALRSDKYWTKDKKNEFSYPDTTIGASGDSNEVEHGFGTGNYSVQDYGLKGHLDLGTANNADAPLMDMLSKQEQVSDGLAFGREQRIATIVGTSGNYGGNTAAVGLAWNDPSGGTILTDIPTAISNIWRGPNPTRLVGVCPLAVWNAGIFPNPALAERFKYTAGGPTLPQQVAQFFGLDDLVIAKAWNNTANEGQTASYSRMWSSAIFAILRVAQTVSRNSLHFGTTFRMNGDPYTTQWQDASKGTRGVVWTRSAVSEDHKVVAGDAAYLITSVTV